MKEFVLPDHAELYVNTVKDRCIDLISYKIWNGIKPVDLNRWFKNFEGDREKYFAACILDNLIYRSDDQIDSLACELFTKKLPIILCELGYDFYNYRSLINYLKNSTVNDIRLVSVSVNLERPTKSSTIILRRFRRSLGLKDNNFITPDEIEKEIKSGIETFIFIDDFLGTGDQFSGMWKEKGLGLKMKDVNVIYAPLVAHETGINSLRDKCSEVRIAFSEFLPNNSSDVFKSAFQDNVNTPESARHFYDKMMEENFKGSYQESNKYGHGSLGLAYTFSHSSPDNCLHIIWDNKNGWHPLIPK